MGFDLATSSFLELLVKKIIQKKMDKYKIKNTIFQIRSKKNSTRFFVSKVRPSHPSPRFKKFRWPVMVVNLGKGQKILKNIENNCKFKRKLAKIQHTNILRTISLSQETIQYLCFKPEIVSLTHKDLYTRNMIKIFQKFDNFKFYRKITKTQVIKKN